MPPHHLITPFSSPSSSTSTSNPPCCCLIHELNLCARVRTYVCVCNLWMLHTFWHVVLFVCFVRCNAMFIIDVQLGVHHVALLIRICMCMCMCLCVCVCVCMCTRARVCVCVCACGASMGCSTGGRHPEVAGVPSIAGTPMSPDPCPDS